MYLYVRNVAYVYTLLLCCLSSQINRVTNVTVAITTQDTPSATPHICVILNQRQGKKWPPKVR